QGTAKHLPRRHGDTEKAKWSFRSRRIAGIARNRILPITQEARGTRRGRDSDTDLSSIFGKRPACPDFFVPSFFRPRFFPPFVPDCSGEKIDSGCPFFTVFFRGIFNSAVANRFPIRRTEFQAIKCWLTCTAVATH